MSSIVSGDTSALLLGDLGSFVGSGLEYDPALELGYAVHTNPALGFVPADDSEYDHILNGAGVAYVDSKTSGYAKFCGRMGPDFTRTESIHAAGYSFRMASSESATPPTLVLTYTNLAPRKRTIISGKTVTIPSGRGITV